VRIALVTPHATPPGSYATSEGGPRVVPLAHALAQQGHDVTIYARKDASALPARLPLAPRVTIEHIKAGPARTLPTDEVTPYVGALSDQLARRWRDNRPDIAHAYSWPAGLAAMAGARDLGLPVTLTFHSLDIPGDRGPLGQPREPLAQLRLKVCLASAVAAVLARSSEEARLLTGLGVPRNKIRVVPWGVDTGHFTPDGPAADRNSNARLLTTWRPSGAGFDVLLRMLADIPQAELVFAGGPPRGRLVRTSLYREVQRLAGKLGVAGRISFTGGVPWEDLPGLLRSADMMVHAASEGLFDVASLQAMACGTPVAAPATGFYPDPVIDGTTGLLAAPGQQALLARRIRHLLASPLQLEAIGIAAADRARSRYSWDRVGQETMRAYERCLPRLVPEEIDLDTDPDLELTESAA
jgi:D-inositol-3-phosphate glycosyltransferase